MPSFLKFLNVNWVNGMKISKDHFIQQDKANDDKIRDAAGLGLNPFNYGLLPVWPGEKTDSFKVIAKIDNQKSLSVDISSCRAVTPDGSRIEILEERSFPQYTVDLSRELDSVTGSEQSEYYILLNIDLFKRDTSGDLDGSENPPRYPNTLPGYSVSILHSDQLSQYVVNQGSMCIGKILLGKDKSEVIENYIPPSMSLRSHNSLMLFYSSVEKFFNQLELDILSILRKINEKNQDTSLALSVKLLSDKLMHYITVQNQRLRWELPDKPPVFLFETIAGFARIMRNTIESSSAANKEELLNYFTNWSELKQGDFEKLLVYCVNFEYKHEDIYNSIEQFEEFVEIMRSLFEKLESLAYIGKKKETSIFVKEDKPKRSFLAD